MPVHDWSRVSAGTFHDFHNSWIVELKRVLNQGLLPEGYYAQSEQDAWDVTPDVLTLQASDQDPGPPFHSGGVAAVTSSPPQVSIVAVADESDGYTALQAGYHLLVIDLHPPGRFDPQGIHGAIWEQFDSRPYLQPVGKPLTLAAYTAALPHKAYVEPLAVGDEMPSMPLFLTVDWYVPLPLEATYLAAFQTIPERWKRVLQG